MPTVAIKTKGGGSAGDVTLSDRVFGATRNIPLMHQAVKAEMENRRQDTKNTLTRGDITGGGRKPFKQKGTGRARQGSIVAPHWRHGGTAFGPHPRDLGHALPKKMKQAAIRSALSSKLADGELIIVDTFPFRGRDQDQDGGDLPRRSRGQSFVRCWSSSKRRTKIVYKSIRNLAGVTLKVAPAFSTRDVVDGGIVVITRAAAEKIDAQWGNEGAEASAPTADATSASAEEASYQCLISTKSSSARSSPRRR